MSGARTLGPQKYTAGPWDISGAFGADRLWIGANYSCINGLSARFVIANVLYPDEAEQGYTDGAYSPETAEANARLIAAAPELLEALEKLLSHWTGEAGPADRDSDQQVERMACAALAKARGAA